MTWPWKRDEAADQDVDVLRAQAAAAAPPGPFRMVVEDVFNIKDRGTVVTGKVAAGEVRVGQQVRVLRAGTVLTTTTVTEVEMFRKVLESATVGENVGLLLDGVTGDNVVRDDVLES